MQKEAPELNALLVDRREVRLDYDKARTDRLGRTLAYVYVKVWDVEVFVNEYLIKVGNAKVATYPPNVKYRDRFVAAEWKAKEKKLGVWSNSPEEVEYFMTKDGHEYHVAGCLYLIGGSIAIELENAKKLFEPCEVCKPGGW